jgi:hypothetical protein
MNDVSKLAELALAQIPSVRKWDEAKLYEWLSWMDASGCVIACYEDGRSIDPLGFAVVRPIVDISKKHQRYHVNERGQTLYCDMAVAPTRKIMQAIGFAVLDRFGQRKFWASSKNDNLKVHDFNSVRKALLRTH